MSINEITGDKMVSKPSTDYGAGYDLIWGKDKKLDKDIRDTRCAGEARERDDTPCCSRQVCSGEET